jgi:hypothetical protein
MRARVELGTRQLRAHRIDDGELVDDFAAHRLHGARGLGTRASLDDVDLHGVRGWNDVLPALTRRHRRDGRGGHHGNHGERRAGEAIPPADVRVGVRRHAHARY